MKTETKIFAIAFAAIFILAIFSGCLDKPKEEFREMQKFKSYAELQEAFSNANQGRSYGLGGMVFGLAGGRMMTKGGAVQTAVGIAENISDSGRGSSDFSITNVQVEGVDEADIVKSDGRHIYNFSKEKLIITDAYPIENSGIVSKTELKGISPSEMFVIGDRLVAFGSRAYDYGIEETQAAAKASRISMPYYWRGGGTVAVLYDISDRENPKVEKELEFEGSYLTSRSIGKNVYFVVNSYPKYYPCGGYYEKCTGNEDENSIIPMMKIDGAEIKIAEATDIGIMPPIPAQSFVTLVSLNVENKEVSKETIAGDAESVFASETHIYLASTVWLPPETPIVSQTPVLKDVERAVVGDEEKTAIVKFGMQDGKIGFLGKGEVPGHVLNQFSMDEYDGKFRIATTKGQLWQTGSDSTNNLYVLDEEMKITGKLEDLAPGEKIYSARFMGKKAYLVTFKKVDPLFVIDLSEPANPKVLGKLKIPGYSDYLHPIDETHLIGIGKDTIESGYGEFAWYQGMKMAIFDVSDVENPKEMHKILIGDRGTDSYALRDHKAFLYDKEKELLVLPIMLAEIQADKKKPLGNEMQSPTYGEPVFQGAFVYNITLENGFEEIGRITHITEEEELKRGYYYGDEYSVKRALYIGDVLYTLSDRMLKANSLDSLSELKEFKF